MMLKAFNFVRFRIIEKEEIKLKKNFEFIIDRTIDHFR